MKAGRFLWGIFFFLLGLMWLGIEFGYISPVSWVRLVQFWPLIIILSGLGIMLRHEKVFSIIGMILILLTFFYAAYSSVTISDFFGFKNEQTIQTSNITRDESDKNLIVNLDAGAADIDLLAMDDNLSKSSLIITESEGMNGLLVDKTTTDGTTTVKISENFEGRVVLGPNQRKISIKIARNIPVEFVYSAGATKAKLDFTEIDLKNFVSKSGATSTEVRLGNKLAETNVSIQSGASDYSVYIPESSGYKVISKSGLSNITFPGEKAIAVGDDVKESPDYGSSTNKINLNINSGLTNIKIIKY